MLLTLETSGSYINLMGSRTNKKSASNTVHAAVERSLWIQIKPPLSICLGHERRFYLVDEILKCDHSYES